MRTVQVIESRTGSQRVGDDIHTAVRNIARDWPDMLPRGGAQVAPGWASRIGVQLADHDPSDADQRRIDRVVSLRRYVRDVLDGWCRFIIEERGTSGGVPLGTDIEGMCAFVGRHAEWMSGHETADDCREELSALARSCHLIVNPPAREMMSIGTCPLVHEPDGECGGDVRVRLVAGERDGEAYGSCNRCGEVAVATWWAERMFVDGEGSPVVTIGELIAVIAYQLRVVVTHDQIRQWKHRGKITSVGTDTKGRSLYRHEEVIESIRAGLRKRIT